MSSIFEKERGYHGSDPKSAAVKSIGVSWLDRGQDLRSRGCKLERDLVVEI